jgi:hypothetical protein
MFRAEFATAVDRRGALGEPLILAAVDLLPGSSLADDLFLRLRDLGISPEKAHSFVLALGAAAPLDEHIQEKLAKLLVSRPGASTSEIVSALKTCPRWTPATKRSVAEFLRAKPIFTRELISGHSTPLSPAAPTAGTPYRQSAADRHPGPYSLLQDSPELESALLDQISALPSDTLSRILDDPALSPEGKTKVAQYARTVKDPELHTQLIQHSAIAAHPDLCRAGLFARVLGILKK